MDCLVSGRKANFEQLFCEHRKGLIDLASRLTKCRRKAEDIVHDVFLKYFELASQTEIREPRQYLYGMVRNHAIDGIRRASLERRYCGGSEEEGMQVPCALNCPEKALQCREALAAVDSALSHLPTRTRRVFEWHRLEGIPQKEIAATIEVSPTLVNFMVKDAHRACTAALAQID